GYNTGVSETLPVAEVRDHFSQVVERVERHHERVVVTRNGRDVAVLVSPEDLAGLEETVEALVDPDLMTQLKERTTPTSIALAHEEARRRWAPPEP
ncbi:MAG: type II toxin-antitoxin system Phd/YefM family antitoxin, partial [Acidimicrobiales bacterium]